MRQLLPLLPILLLLLFSCNEDVSGTTDETEIVGTVVLQTGEGAENARIELFETTNSSTIPLLVTESNKSGDFVFSKVNVGTYRILASLKTGNDSLSALFTGVTIQNNGDKIDAGLDTLRAGGYIHGQLINADSTFAKAVTAYVPGTSFLAISDSLGLFTISSVPASTYRLSFLGHGLIDTLTDEFSVRFKDTTKLGIITLHKHDTLIYRDIYGTFSDNSESVAYLTAEIYGDSVTLKENQPQKIIWNPISKGFSGYVIMPAKGDSFTVTVKVYSTSKRLTGVFVLPFTKESGDILIPPFDAHNAKPHIELKDEMVVSKNTSFTLPIMAVDSFGGSCVLYKWDIDNDGVYDDSSYSNTEISVTYSTTGAHSIVVLVLDNDGNWSMKTVKVTVPNQNPTVQFLSPSQDTLIWDTVRSVPLQVSFFDTFGGTIKERTLEINGKAQQFSTDIDYQEELTSGNNVVIASCIDDDNNSISDTINIRLEYIRDISASNGNSFFITHKGDLWAGGNNYQGKLGLGDKGYHSIFEQVDSGVATVKAGQWHTCFIGNNDRLFAFGSNNVGQLGLGTMGHAVHETDPNFVRVNTQKVALGKDFTLLLTTNGSLYAMGRNENDGAFGLPDNPGSTTPVYVRDGVKDIAAGASHSLVLLENGTLLTVGDNFNGQLGNADSGYSAQEDTFQVVLSNVTKVAAGQDYSMAIDDNGTLWAWGQNRMGQLGNGKSGNGEISIVPEEIMGGVTDVSCGLEHTLILKSNGSLWVTGDNGYGQLGTGNTELVTIPTMVLTDVKNISAGFAHSLIVLTSGELQGCGDNDDNQLGPLAGETENEFVTLIK